jgi:hypothetical protein
LGNDIKPAALLAAVAEPSMHELIYLVGLVVVVMFILGALGLR